MRLIAMLLPAALLQSTAVSAQEVLALEDLKRIVADVRTFQPRDQFDEPPRQQSLAGRRFSYVVAPMPLAQKPCSGFPDWTYLAVQQKLVVGWYAGHALTYDLRGPGGAVFPPAIQNPRRPALNYRGFECLVKAETDYQATNAFGASFTVTKTHEVVAAIADFDSLTTRRRPPSSAELSASGEIARSLSQNVRLRVSGVLNDWWEGMSVVCATKRLEPRVTLPIDRTTDLCLIRGQVTQVEVIDERTGAVLSTVNMGE